MAKCAAQASGQIVVFRRCPTVVARCSLLSARNAPCPAELWHDSDLLVHLAVVAAVAVVALVVVAAAAGVAGVAASSC